jgi:hypothetical protein
MSRKTDPAHLATMSDSQLEHDFSAAVERAETRTNRATVECRDFTSREAELTAQDREEMTALKAEIERRAAVEARSAEVLSEIGRLTATGVETRSGQSPFLPSAENITRLDNARKRFENITVLETRAAVATTDAGTAREYGPNGLQAPRSLWRSAGIPTTAPDGYAAVTPQFTLPSGVALVAEGTNHAEFDGVNPDAVTIGRAGAWTTLTGEALLSSSISEVSQAHARIIARNVDKATLAKLEDSTPDTFSIDVALATVAGECACDVSDLWIVGNAAAVAALAGNAVFTPANGPDAGSYATRYGGAALYISPAATAERLTVFFPGAFRAFASPLASSIVVDPKSGSQTAGAWMFYGLGQALAGSACTVDTTP